MRSPATFAASSRRLSSFSRASNCSSAQARSSPRALFGGHVAHALGEGGNFAALAEVFHFQLDQFLARRTFARRKPLFDLFTDRLCLLLHGLFSSYKTKRPAANCRRAQKARYHLHSRNKKTAFRLLLRLTRGARPPLLSLWFRRGSSKGNTGTSLGAAFQPVSSPLLQGTAFRLSFSSLSIAIIIPQTRKKVNKMRGAGTKFPRPTLPLPAAAQRPTGARQRVRAMRAPAPSLYADAAEQVAAKVSVRHLPHDDALA